MTSIPKELQIKSDSDIEELTQRIAELHTELLGSFKIGLEKAIEIGGLLTQAKKKIIPYGQFGVFCKTLPFSERTAQNYIRVYKNREFVKSETFSDLSSFYEFLKKNLSPEVETIAATTSQKPYNEFPQETDTFKEINNQQAEVLKTPEYSKREMVNKTIKDIDNHLLQATNLMKDIQLQYASQTLVRMLYENYLEYLKIFSELQNTLAEFMKTIDPAKIDDPEYPLAKTDPVKAMEALKLQAKILQSIKESPKINRIVNSAVSTGLAMENMPLNKMTDVEQQKWVVKRLMKLQEFINDYITIDITPLENKSATEWIKLKNKLAITEGEIVAVQEKYEQNS
jgi:Protein of unknown function (DUF3102)